MMINPDKSWARSQYRFPGMVIPIVKVLRPSYLYNGNAYTGKTTFLYWDGLWLTATTKTVL